MQLDAFVEAGVNPAQFQELFAQCEKCEIRITRRDASQHDCKTAMSTLPANAADDRERLLHSIRSDGLPQKRFEALFHYCKACDRIMTVKAAGFHECERKMVEKE